MANKTVVDATGLKGEYLADWDGFIGQTEIKENLRISAVSAKMRGTRLPHIFLNGEGGYGKTQLAILVALTMGKRIIVISGGVDVNQFRIIASDMEDGDVILWDEFHLSVIGGVKRVEFMLNVLQDGCVKGPNGVAEELPDITVIACTTDVGKIPGTILDRFRMIELTRYSDDEAVQVAEGWADRILCDAVPGVALPYPSSDNLEQIARAASNNPRRMLRIMEMLRDIAFATELGNFTKGTPDSDGQYDLAGALKMLGLTQDGLTLTAQRYLVALLRQGGAAGERPLMDALNVKDGLGHVEKLLMDKDMIYKGKGGRVLTQVGIRRAKELRAEGVS